MIEPSTEVLAEDLRRQADRLWSHLPEDLVSSDDTELLFRTDSVGNLMVALGDVIYLLRDDVAWAYSEGSTEALAAYRNREPVGDALIGGTG